MISNIYVLDICYSILIVIVHSLRFITQAVALRNVLKVACALEQRATITCSLASHSLKFMVT